MPGFRRSHEHRRQRSKKRQANQTMLDSVVMVEAFVSPLLTAPQAIDVWMHPNAGINEITWCGWSLFALIWMFYGIAHRLRPVVISNALWVIADLTVAVGAALHR